MSLEESRLNSSIPPHTVKHIAETCSIAYIPNDVAMAVAHNVTYKLKVIIQCAMKFMGHAKRNKLNCTDIDYTLKAKYVEPLYGHDSPDLPPFSSVIVDGQEFFYHEEEDLDLDEIINGEMPKLPLDVSLEAHWLSIDGVPQDIPANPPSTSKGQEKLDGFDQPSQSSKISGLASNKTLKRKRSKCLEVVQLKEPSAHHLSMEQQLYYKELTVACLGSNIYKRLAAFESLSSDPGLYEILPYLCSFISERVKIYIDESNVVRLIHLMKMVKALLNNETLYLEKYLHEILPSVVSCVVAKKPDCEGSHILRTYSSQIAYQIIKNFGTNIPDLQLQLFQQYNKVLMNEKLPLCCFYGALAGLSPFFNAAIIEKYVLPRLEFLDALLTPYLESSMAVCNKESENGFVYHILLQLQKAWAIMERTYGSLPDSDDYYSGACGIQVDYSGSNETQEDSIEVYDVLGDFIGFSEMHADSPGVIEMCTDATTGVDTVSDGVNNTELRETQLKHLKTIVAKGQRIICSSSASKTPVTVLEPCIVQSSVHNPTTATVPHTLSPEGAPSPTPQNPTNLASSSNENAFAIITTQSALDPLSSMLTQIGIQSDAPDVDGATSVPTV